MYNYSTINIENNIEKYIIFAIFKYSKYLINSLTSVYFICKLYYGLTKIAMVTNTLVLGVKHSLFQHSQDDHSTNPELDPEQVPPVASQPEQPQRTEEHIQDAHDHVEL